MHPSLLGRLCSPALVLVALGLGACSGNVPDGADATASTTQALVVVEQSVPQNASDTARANASAWFLRVNDPQSLNDANRLVTDVFDVPAVGSCAVLGSQKPPSATSPMSPVELAYAGDVVVQTDRSRVQLAMRAFPDLANLVSGVVYTARNGSDLLLPAAGTIAVKASGGYDLAPIDAEAYAPAPPDQVTVNGQSLSSDSVSLRGGAPIEISWNAENQGDFIYVDLEPSKGSRSATLRCSLADTGSGQIDAPTLPSAELRFSLHRVRTSPLKTATHEVGLARFDFAVTGRAKVALP